MFHNIKHSTWGADTTWKDFLRKGESGQMTKIACCCCCEVASVMSNSVQPHRRQSTRLHRSWDSPGKNTGVGCHFLLQCMKVKSERKVSQSCPTLSDPVDCSLPGSSVHGTFQARVLEWVAIAFSERPLGQYQTCQYWNYRSPRRKREKERVWEIFWRDYSWKFPQYGKGNNQVQEAQRVPY